MSDAPERVWINHDEIYVFHDPKPERIANEYIRADIHEAEIAHVENRVLADQKVLANMNAEVARLREALEDIVTTLAVGEDWCGFCGTLSHHPHIRDCPYPIARRALEETTDE